MHFEKISYEQWEKDVKRLYPTLKDEDIKVGYDNIKLPQQATKHSMGMDFYSPFVITMSGNSMIVVPTGIRWVVDKRNTNKGLCVYPRSGLGVKFGVYLENTVGIIDADYYQAENEGHILIKIHNPYEDIVIAEGEAFAQGVITNYYICEGAESNDIRTGGFGSTDRR